MVVVGGAKEHRVHTLQEKFCPVAHMQHHAI
jgi:hypothetical protein